MKSILYFGAALMIGASIYGFVDYSKTSHNKKFSNMYETKEVKEPVIMKEDPVPVTEEKKEAPKKTAKKAVTKEPSKEESNIYRSKQDLVAAEKLESDPVTTETATLKENGSAEKYKKAKKRKLNHKLFSRAPLREEFDEAELIIPEKTEADTKKAVAKKQ